MSSRCSRILPGPRKYRWKAPQSTSAVGVEVAAVAEAAVAARGRERAFAPVSRRSDQVINNAKLLAYANRTDPALVESLWTVMLKWFELYEDRLIEQKRPE